MYRGARLQLLCLAILEREDVPSNATHPTAPNHDSLNYQVRILVQGVTASTFHAVLASSVPCTVTSVGGCPTANEVYDSNFNVATFHSAACPDQLRLVTHILADGVSMFLHHHRQFQRAPCFTCYSPYHSSSKCSSTRGNILHDHHRVFTGVHRTSKPISSSDFSHLDVTERLDHVTLLATTLETSKNRL